MLISFLIRHFCSKDKRVETGNLQTEQSLVQCTEACLHVLVLKDLNNIRIPDFYVRAGKNICVVIGSKTVVAFFLYLFLPLFHAGYIKSLLDTCCSVSFAFFAALTIVVATLYQTRNVRVKKH